MEQDSTEDYSEKESNPSLEKKIKKLKKKVKRLETQFASLCKLVNCTVAFFPGDKVPIAPPCQGNTL